MAEGLKGYDGPVNGQLVSHGIVIQSQTLAARTDLPQQMHQQSQTEIESIVNRATEVIGNREEALRWLGTPVRALDYATPISRLYDAIGREQVLRVLTQLEHSVL